MWCLSCATDYLDGREVDVEGIVTHMFAPEESADALDAIRTKQCNKAVVMPGLQPSKIFQLPVCNHCIGGLIITC
jgi:hypothetical protein